MSRVKKEDFVQPAEMLVASGADTGAAFYVESRHRTFQATNNASGGTNIVDIEGSNDGVQWVQIGQLEPTDANGVDGFYSEAPWLEVRARVTTYGAGQITVTLGA